MAKYSLFIDTEKCIGCHSCEVACKQVNNLHSGPRPIHVITVGPIKTNGKLMMHFVPTRCMHCGKPPCLEACPVEAITKRSDGIVLIDEELCTGCKACIEACSFGAMKYNEEKDVAVKCTLCVDRIKKDQEPMCVKHCPSKAIQFGDINITCIPEVNAELLFLIGRVIVVPQKRPQILKLRREG